MRVSVYLNLGAQVCMYACDSVSCQSFDSVRSEFRSHLQKVAEIGRGARGGYIPFLRRIWKTLKIPSPTFPPRLFFCCQFF